MSSSALEEKKQEKKWKHARIINKHVKSSSTRTHGSIENALWHLPTRITLSSFVRAMVGEFRFERHSRVENHLTSFFESFGRDSVDTRIIVCIFRVFTLCPETTLTPQQSLKGKGDKQKKNNALIFKFWHVFADPSTNTVRRDELLDLISLGSVTADDFDATRGKISKLIPPTISKVSLSLLENALTTHPGIGIDFREQLFSRLPLTTRLSVLSHKEEVSLQNVTERLQKLSLRRSIRHWSTITQRHVFDTWLEHVRCRLSRERQRTFIRCYLAKRALRYWRLYSGRRGSIRRMWARAVVIGDTRTMRVRFRGWRKVARVERRVWNATLAQSKMYKSIGAGLGVLRRVWWRAWRRKCLRKWQDDVEFEILEELAGAWRVEQVKKGVMRYLRRHAVEEITMRRKEGEAEERQRLVEKMMQEMHLEMERLEQEQRLEEQRRFDKERREVEHAKRMEEQRRRADLQARDRHILEIQELERKKRIKKERAVIMTAWEEKWRDKKVEMERSCYRRADEWLSSNAAKEVLLKQFKDLERDFYMAPSVENRERERMLKSNANICLAVLDGKLFDKGIDVKRDFLHLLKQQTLQQHYQQSDHDEHCILSYNHFIKVLHHLKISLEPSFLRGLYNELHEKKQDNNTCRTDDGDDAAVLPLHKIASRIKTTYQYNGPKGTPWKKYISPAHEIMMFHNVVTDERILESDMTKKKMKDIVRETARVGFLLRDRRQFWQEREKDCQLIQMEMAATVLQKMFWVWKGRKERGKMAWKLDLRNFRRQRRFKDYYFQKMA
mmetsp:Transcript_51985/g.62532  ORF Transcript_51985/g.62532 Transcript_51985/m.62532 type:complete len:784 (-) Transcript_51985:69-2420(-)